MLIAKVGDPPGTAAVYPISEPAGIVSQDVIRIKPNREIIHPEFLTKFLNSDVGYNILKPIFVEGTRERFGLTPIKQLDVPIPPLRLQEEFAGMVARVEFTTPTVHCVDTSPCRAPLRVCFATLAPARSAGEAGGGCVDIVPEPSPALDLPSKSGAGVDTASPVRINSASGMPSILDKAFKGEL